MDQIQKEHLGQPSHPASLSSSNILHGGTNLSLNVFAVFEGVLCIFGSEFSI